MLHSVVADYAFIGADAVHPQYGVASRTLEQSRLKTLMMQRARQIVVVADRRKINTDQFNYWSPVPTRWRLITDDDADAKALSDLRAVGATWISSHPSGSHRANHSERFPHRDDHLGLGCGSAVGSGLRTDDTSPGNPAPAQRLADRGGGNAATRTR